MNIARQLMFAFELVALWGCAAPQTQAPLSSRIAAASIANEAASLIGDGKFIDAEQKYRLALQDSPNDVALHLGLATALARQVPANSRGATSITPQGAEARKIFEELLTERPDALGIVLGAAAGFEALGDRQQALKLFERGFTLTDDPAIASVALRNFATVAFNAGSYQEATSASQKAYETKPSAAEASRHLALLNPLGMTSEAVKFAEQVISLYGSDGELLTRAAAAFAAAGDCVQAEQVAIRAIEMGKIAEKIRRDALIEIDWCHGHNRLGELTPAELASWPIKMRP